MSDCDGCVLDVQIDLFKNLVLLVGRYPWCTFLKRWLDWLKWKLKKMTKDQLSSKQNPSALTPWWFHIPMVRVSTSDPHPLGRRIGAWISKWLKVWSHPSYMFPFKAVHRVTFSPHSNGSVWNCCETLHIAKSWTTLPVSFPAGEFQYNSAYVGAHLRMNMIYESAHEPHIKHLYRSHI